MLIKFLLLLLALATPSFGRRRYSPDCLKFVEKEDTLTFESCSDFNILDGIDVEKIEDFHGQNHNQVENLVAGQFKKLPNLKKIQLQRSGIKKVDELAFEELTKLERLDLFQNSLGKLPENLFKDLVNLEYLNLKKSQVEDLPANFFKHNKKLQVLWLDENYLTQIPTGLFYPLKKLRLLSLRNNQLEILHQDTFQENKNLWHLMFAFNQIKAIAKGTFDNLDLENLDFRNNVCFDQQFGDYEAWLKITDYNKALEKCYANYETL
jgi:Leucine-rich repeat (LRR) protein